MKHCFKFVMASGQRKNYLYSRLLGKASKLIDKWLEESRDEPESELEVPGNSDSYFSDESDSETN